MYIKKMHLILKCEGDCMLFLSIIALKKVCVHADSIPFKKISGQKRTSHSCPPMAKWLLCPH